MKKIKNYLFKLIPPYGWIAIISIVTMNMFVYYGTKAVAGSFRHYDFTSDLDRLIPFVPAFIIVYIFAAYGQWWYGYYLAAREDKKTVVTIFGAEIIAKVLCLIIFLALPTTMTRAEITGNDIFSRLTSMIYSADTPSNLFPSIHCLESYLLWRTLPMLKNAPGWYRKITPFVTLLVFASVVLVKQHILIDIPGAIAVTEAGLFTVKAIQKHYYNKKAL